MKKITAFLLLALLVIVPCFAACNDPADDTGKNNSEVSEEAGFPLEYQKFDNATVTILAVATSRHTYGEMQFVPSDETDGNVINDVVAERNNYIEQQYGITIELVSESYPNEKIDDMLAVRSIDIAEANSLRKVHCAIELTSVNKRRKRCRRFFENKKKRNA